MEQAFEHVLEQLAVALEHGGELLGISLVAGHVLLGEIEHAGDVLHLAFRHLEHFLEGVDLVHGDDAVGLGHLGAERDHAHGEGHLVLGRPVFFLVAVDDVVPGHASEQRADRSADLHAKIGRKSRARAKVYDPGIGDAFADPKEWRCSHAGQAGRSPRTAAWNTRPKPPARRAMAAQTEVEDDGENVAAVPRRSLGSFGVHAGRFRGCELKRRSSRPRGVGVTRASLPRAPPTKPMEQRVSLGAGRRQHPRFFARVDDGVDARPRPSLARASMLRA